MRKLLCVALFAVALCDRVVAQQAEPDVSGFNVRSFGAVGDGKSLDTPAINKAIDEAASHGGGTVYFPAGDYLSVSIHLKSNVALYVDQGATIVAADPKEGAKYDAPEPNESDQFQDFGHTHFHNSLIWGENLHDVSILGPGRIWGKGLVRSGSQSRTKEQNDALRERSRNRAPTDIDGENPSHTAANAAAPNNRPRGKFGYPSAGDAVETGWGNKSIALKLCRNVIIRDVSILHGGHFGILATGVDNLTIDDVKLDTNRDGMDIDACRNVRVSNCSVNSPWDDGICLKSTFALGEKRACENVTITNCQVSGYDEGTFLDGTFQRKEKERYSHKTTTGRVKFGTESNGGFKNITISNCIFDYSRGLALELVDGGDLEDVTITNVTMRDIVNAPIYLRLGSRNRAPDGTPTGVFRRVTISNVVIHNAPVEQSVIIAGVPDHSIEDLRLDNIRIDYAGGGTEKMASTRPSDHETDYPEPANHGPMPAYGFFIRHVKNLQMSGIDLSYDNPDVRPPFVVENVSGADFVNVKAKRESDNSPVFVLRNLENFSTHRVNGLPDMQKDKIDDEKH
jgi:polygalacturonase